jgi:hypothetical protein
MEGRGWGKGKGGGFPLFFPEFKRFYWFPIQNPKKGGNLHFLHRSIILKSDWVKINFFAKKN